MFFLLDGTWLNNQRIEPQRYYELKEEVIIFITYQTTMCFCFIFVCPVDGNLGHLTLRV